MMIRPSLRRLYLLTVVSGPDLLTFEFTINPLRASFAFCFSCSVCMCVGCWYSWCMVGNNHHDDRTNLDYGEKGLTSSMTRLSIIRW